MAKKRSKKKGGDARGYATTSIASAVIPVVEAELDPSGPPCLPQEGLVVVDRDSANQSTSASSSATALDVDEPAPALIVHTLSDLPVFQTPNAHDTLGLSRQQEELLESLLDNVYSTGDGDTAIMSSDAAWQLRNAAQTASRPSSKIQSRKTLTYHYDALVHLGFAEDDVEAALSKSQAESLGELVLAISIAAPVERLPDAVLSTRAQELKRAANKPVLQASQSAARPPSPFLVVAAEQPARCLVSAPTGKPARPALEMSAKEWILQRAALGDESEEEADVVLAVDQPVESITQQFLKCQAQLQHALEEAKRAKSASNKADASAAGREIAALKVALRTLTDSPDFDVSLVEADAATVSSPPSTDDAVSVPALAPDDDESVFDLFAEDRRLGPAADEQAAVSVVLPPMFELTHTQWAGATPEYLLMEAAKKLGKPRPSFGKGKHGVATVALLGVPASKLEVLAEKRGIPVFEATEDNDGLIRVKTTAELRARTNQLGRQLACLQLLFLLSHHTPTHKRMARDYADLWLGWLGALKSHAEVEQQEELQRREAFLDRLLGMKQPSMETMVLGVRVNVPASALPDDTLTWEALDLDDVDDRDVEEDRAAVESDQPLEPKSQRSAQPNVGSAINWHEHAASRAYQAMLPVRQQLPVFGFKDSIMASLAKHQVLIVAGQTGSGKSTQVPQFVLEWLLTATTEGDRHVYCTQPRRISAVSIATRVCAELGEPGPGNYRSLCGYHVRMDKKTSAQTRLTYCTTGILLRLLQGSPDLAQVAVVIVDEVHERSVQSDFLLILLRQLLARRPHIKVVLMSATLDAERMANYFSGSKVDIVSVPGRTFPVEEVFVEDAIEATGYELDLEGEYAQRRETWTSSQVEYTGERGRKGVHTEAWVDEQELEDTLDPDVYSRRTRKGVDCMRPDRINMELIETLIDYIVKEHPVFSKIHGSILVFMPGLKDIQDLYQRLTSTKECMDGKLLVIPLHSILGGKDQSKAFDVPPVGVRKVVISTNIAETGVTIPDVVCVIDSGLVKETRYKDHSRMTLLANTSISKASAKQRAGRAGRVQAGICFRLYTRAAHSKFLSFTKPEIQRVPLEDLCLHVLSSTEHQPFELLSQALDPPAASAVTSAVKHLDELGALEAWGEDVQLTTLGRCMARLPLDVHLSKLLIVAVGLDCLEDALTVAAAMSYQSPFVSPFDKRDAAEAAKRQFHPECLSDSLAVVNAYNQWQHLKQSQASSLAMFCRKNFLHSNRLQQLARARQDLRRTLASALPRLPPQSGHSSPDRLRQALVAALAPQIARQDYQEAQKRRLSLVFHQGVAGRIHPSSLTTSLSPLPVQRVRWLAYQSRMETTSSFALECSVASPLWLALFGRSFAVKPLEEVVIVDGWIRLKCGARMAQAIQLCRQVWLDDLTAVIEQGQVSELGETLLRAGLLLD